MKQLIRIHSVASALILAVAFFVTAGCQQKPDPSQQLKPSVDKYVDVWNGGNPEQLNATVDPHFVRHVNLQPNVEGLDGLKRVISGLRTAYPDLKITLNDEIYAENKSVVRWTLVGTNTGAGEVPPTGKAVKIWGESIVLYANGKMTEEWIAFDNQSFMEQLGYTLTPSPATK